MSLDIFIEGAEEIEEKCACPHCDDVHIVKRYPHIEHLNITHNLVDMADAVGLYKYVWRPEENGITTAGEMINHLEKGIEELRMSPSKYKKLNPTNGWGNYDGLLVFLNKYLSICQEHPTAKITVSR